MSRKLLKKGARGKSLLVALLCAGLFAMLAYAQEESEPAQANLDNDPSENDLETYSEDTALAAGVAETEDQDGDKDFDLIRVGVAGGGTIFGVADFDGKSDEVELVVTDPTLASEKVRLSDEDEDGDYEVIWAGAQGADMDGDGLFEVEESGAVVGLEDLNKDENPEIIVLDASRTIGRFHAAGLDINRQKRDGFEVVWVGILHPNGRARAAAFEEITDYDGDGESEIILRDIRTDNSGSGFAGQGFDVDRDGDDDIVLIR